MGPGSGCGATERCEILVIGSGAGGSLTATLLAEAGRDVILVEEGPFVPPGSLRPFSADEFLVQYREGGITPAFGVPPIPYVEGRCVGGGTEINAALYHRPPPDAVDRWRTQWRIDGFDPAALDESCRMNEEAIGLAYHAGPRPPMSEKLVAGARALGWRVQEVPRLYRYPEEGSGGGRGSMTRTLIPRALSAGLRLIPDCLVSRLRGSGGRITLAETVRTKAGRSETALIRADRYFVCGGAVQTPLLLQRSGIGKLAGRTFGIHPTVRCAARFEEPMDGHRFGVPVHQVKEHSPGFSIGGSVTTPAHIGAFFADNWATHENDFPDWRRIGIFYAAARGTSDGSVRVLPGFPNTGIVRYPLSGAGVRSMWEALEKLGELLWAAGALSLYPSVSRMPPIRSRDEWRRFISGTPDSRRLSLMSVHLFGSCPMGEDLSKCVTDSYGAVHGCDNLWINDAALIPDGPGVNPEGTILGIARRNVDAFLQR